MNFDILKRLQAGLEPIAFLAIAVYGALLVSLEILTFQGTLDVFHPSRVKDRVFGKMWHRLNATFAEKELETVLPSLDARAYGTVLEIGPATGNQLSRYDKSKIQRVYGVEPNFELHDALRATIISCGLSDIYTIVPCGVEDLATLEMYGVAEGSVDTVMSVQVLCSVPKPAESAKAMYRMLKPGGQMIVYEHVRSGDVVTKFLQEIYNLVWPYVMGNCNLNRPTAQYLYAAGKWSSIEVEEPGPADAYILVPRTAGRLVK